MDLRAITAAILLGMAFFAPRTLGETAPRSNSNTINQQIVAGIRFALIESRCSGGSVLILKSPIESREGERIAFTGDFDDERDYGEHGGIDIAVARGTPVRAIAGGKVSLVAYHKDYGHYVKIDHGNRVKTLYAHLDEEPQISGSIRAGQQIGLVGSSGNSTGPHLHFELKCYEENIDPDPKRLLPYQ